MSRYWTDQAIEQFEGMANDDELGRHVPTPHEKLKDGIAFGVWVSLLAINESLRELVKVQRLLIPKTVATLGLHVANTPRKDSVMGPLSNRTLPTLSIDTAHDAQYAGAPKDAAGNPVTDTLTWSSSNPDALEITASADGLTALAVTKAAGTSTVHVTDGVLTDSQDVVVSAVIVPVADSLGTSVTIVPKA